MKCNLIEREYQIEKVEKMSKCKYRIKGGDMIGYVYNVEYFIERCLPIIHYCWSTYYRKVIFVSETIDVREGNLDSIIDCGLFIPFEQNLFELLTTFSATSFTAFPDVIFIIPTPIIPFNAPAELLAAFSIAFA